MFCAFALVGCAMHERDDDVLARAQLRVIEPGGPMSTTRPYMSCARLGDGRIVVVGGPAQQGTFLSTAEAYDPATNKFGQLAAMSSGRVDHSAITLATGEVLVTGGYLLSTAELYDPRTNLWRATGALKTERGLHGSALLKDGRVIVFGGRYTVGRATEVFDPKTGTWQDGPPLNASSRVSMSVVRMIDGRVLVVGDDVMDVGEVLTADGTSWSVTGTMKGPRKDPAAALLRDGRVLLIGGYDATKQRLSTTEIYDPPTNTWSDGPTMLHARAGHSVVTLTSGALLVAGGEPLKTVERLDGDTQWTDVGVMRNPREYFCAHPIPGGAIFFAGAFNSAGESTEASDVYRGATAAGACALSDECASGSCVGGSCAAASDAGTDAPLAPRPGSRRSYPRTSHAAHATGTARPATASTASVARPRAPRPVTRARCPAP